MSLLALRRAAWRKLESEARLCADGQARVPYLQRAAKDAKPMRLPSDAPHAERIGKRLLRLSGAYARGNVADRDRLAAGLLEAAQAVDVLLTEAADNARRHRADIDD